MPVVSSYNWWENYPADTTDILMSVSEALGTIDGILKTKNYKSRFGLHLSARETQILIKAVESIRDQNNELYDNLRYAVEKVETPYPEEESTLQFSSGGTDENI